MVRVRGYVGDGESFYNLPILEAQDYSKEAQYTKHKARQNQLKICHSTGRIIGTRTNSRSVIKLNQRVDTI